MTLVAWLFLWRCDRLHRRGFRALAHAVRGYPTRRIFWFAPHPRRAARAIEVAAALYVRPLYCLQRAAALTMLLRSLGVTCTLVIGHRQLPLDAHAWVRVNDVIINANEQDDRLQYAHRFEELTTW